MIDSFRIVSGIHRIFRALKTPVLFIVLPAIGVLLLFLVVTSRLAGDLAIADDIRSQAPSVALLRQLSSEYASPTELPQPLATLWHALTKPVRALIFHDGHGQSLASDYAFSTLPGKQLGALKQHILSASTPQSSSVSGRYTNQDETLVWSTQPLDEATWVTWVVDPLHYHDVVPPLKDVRLLLMALLALGLSLWVVAYNLRNYSHHAANTSSELHRRALLDPLTGLHNRLGLDELLLAYQQSSTPDSPGIALISLDIAGFRDVNDTLGHVTGDQLLVELSRRIRSVISADVPLVRMGGNNFAVLLPSGRKRGPATAVINQLHDAIERPLRLGDVPLNLHCHIGAAFLPLDTNDTQELIRYADIALSLAKKSNQSTCHYQADSDPHSVRKLSLLAELRNAIDSNALELVYQPKVSLLTNSIAGVEALARWTHPVFGSVPPMEFVTLAEKSGLINRLTHWVLEAAERQSAAWQTQGVYLPIAVNLSPLNLYDTELTPLVRRLVTDGSFTGGLLELELTENSLMEDPVTALRTMHDLRKIGLSIAIDDFGTGLSSFSYLRKFPVSNLKIDRSFVMELSEDQNDVVLLRSMIELGHNLNCVVTAEGVEDLESLERLRNFGCDYAQGYYISRPINADEILDWISIGHWRYRRRAA